MSGFAQKFAAPVLGAAGQPTIGSWIAGSIVQDSNGLLWACTVSGTPGTWVEVATASGTVPGTLLATQVYAPASLTTYTVTTGAPAACDTTNATLAFTVPASGNVDFRLSAGCAVGYNGAPGVLALALLNHTGGAQVGNTTLVLDAAVAGVTNEINLIACQFHLTGLSGSLQLDLAASCTIVNGGFVYAHGYTGAASSSKIAPLILQAFAA